MILLDFKVIKGWADNLELTDCGTCADCHKAAPRDGAKRSIQELTIALREWIAG